MAKITNNGDKVIFELEKDESKLLFANGKRDEGKRRFWNQNDEMSELSSFAKSSENKNIYVKCGDEYFPYNNSSRGDI